MKPLPGEEATVEKDGGRKETRKRRGRGEEEERKESRVVRERFSRHWREMRKSQGRAGGKGAVLFIIGFSNQALETGWLPVSQHAAPQLCQSDSTHCLLGW